MLERDGTELLYRPVANFSDKNFDVVRELLVHPNTVVGLSDAGAHCAQICDAGFPTFLLQYWGRDRRNDRLPLEWLVRRQTSETARYVGLLDRGELRVGMKADVNVIDYDHLGVGPPEMQHDLPAGGRRLVQRAKGYVATIVNGVVTVRDGELTGRLPGRVVRGSQPAPPARSVEVQ
jgi:N-acyl-D-aspartate/D-glutamate deacylase